MADRIIKNYWKECVGIAADECGATLTDEQLEYIAESVEGGNECYGMAFYSPPPSDRLHAIEQEGEAKIKRLQREFDAYRGNAEIAIKRALRQYPDANVSIEEHGEVFRHGGRTEQIA